ncbi:unnamed protein product [Candida parapsilosis]
MPYYAVAKGRNSGVYNNWSDCKDQVNGYSGASYKKFSTAAEARSFVSGGGSGGSGGGTSRSGGSGGGYSGGYSGGYCGSSSSTSKVSKPSTTSLTPTSTKTLKVYVDGASRGNGQSKSAASGYGVYYGPNDSRNAAVGLHEVDNINKYTPTNQRAELHGMKHALTNIKNDLSSGKPSSGSSKYDIYSDSKYAIQSINEWSDRWQANGWKTSTGQPVANVDLIKDAVKLKNDINQLHRERDWQPLQFYHVKGHSGDVGNEAADRLANQGADKMGK